MLPLRKRRKTSGFDPLKEGGAGGSKRRRGGGDEEGEGASGEKGGGRGARGGEKPGFVVKKNVRRNQGRKR
jgi:hypothetical protein